VTKMQQENLDALALAAQEMAEAFQDGPATRVAFAQEVFLAALEVSGAVPDRASVTTNLDKHAARVRSKIRRLREDVALFATAYKGAAGASFRGIGARVAVLNMVFEHMTAEIELFEGAVMLSKKEVRTLVAFAREVECMGDGVGDYDTLGDVEQLAKIVLGRMQHLTAEIGRLEGEVLRSTDEGSEGD